MGGDPFAVLKLHWHIVIIITEISRMGGDPFAVLKRIILQMCMP